MARRDIATINLILKPGDVPAQLKQLERAVRQAKRQAIEDRKSRRKGIAAGKGRPSVFQLGRKSPFVGAAVSGSARFSSRTNRNIRRARLITGQFKIFTDTAQLTLEISGDLIGAIFKNQEQMVRGIVNLIPGGALIPDEVIKEISGSGGLDTFKKNIAKAAGTIPATLSSLGQTARIISIIEDLGISRSNEEILNATADLFAARLTTEEIESLVRGRERAALLKGIAQIFAELIAGD